MGLLARAGYLFVGQNIRYDGQRAFATFADVPSEQRIEFPVAENLQLGFCTGLSLAGAKVLSFFPRIDFLLCAADQLVNHLDKIEEMGGARPKVIIRTAIGYNAGPQHSQDHTTALRSMLRHIPLMQLDHAEFIEKTYASAMEYPGSVLIVEYARKYDD